MCAGRDVDYQQSILSVITQRDWVIQFFSLVMSNRRETSFFQVGWNKHNGSTIIELKCSVV
jgi:hypothetical protein